MRSPAVEVRERLPSLAREERVRLLGACAGLAVSSVDGALTPERAQLVDQGLNALSAVDPAVGASALIAIQDWPELHYESEDEEEDAHRTDAITILFYALDHLVAGEIQAAKWAVQRTEDWADVFDNGEGNYERFGDNLLGLLDGGTFAGPMDRAALQAAVAELREGLFLVADPEF